MLDYGSPFTFLFNDKAWFKKFAIASLLTYTIIGAAPAMGWMVEVVRRIGYTETPELPEWEDWKTFWRLGGQFISVNILWLLPVVFAMIVVYIPLIFANRLPVKTLLAIWGGTLFCALIFFLLYSIFYILFFPAMLVVLARTGSIWQSANPVRLWKTVLPHLTGYLLVFLIVGLGLFNIILLVSALTLFLLLPPLLVYLGLVTAHCAGQLMKME